MKAVETIDGLTVQRRRLSVIRFNTDSGVAGKHY